MSRTWRNRHAIPKGFRVRDGIPWAAYDSEGNEYYFDSYTHTEVKFRRFSPNLWTWGGPVNPTPFQGWQIAYFSTRKVPHTTRYIKKFRRSRYSKETKEWRKFCQGRYRARVRNKMSQDLWDEIPKEKKTCGWGSW